MRPFADDLWWPVGLALAVMVSLLGVAVALVDRRDVGRGLWPERRGSAHAGRALLSPAGLVWRLQRGAVRGLGGRHARFGLIFGALSERIADLQGTAATEWYAAVGGDVDLVGAYWASMMQIAGMAVGIQVVTHMLRLRHDEAQDTLEPVLGTAVSRLRWLGA